jgi:gamma-tubulin complex component 5
VRKDLKNSEDVDAMIEVHSSYIKMATDQALLGSRLELIHKTILNILDLGIKLEDAQAANSVANKEALEQQQEMMDLSMASLGLYTPQRKGKFLQSPSKSTSNRKHEPDSSSDDDEKDIDVDLSILSSTFNDGSEELLFIDKLRKMKGDFDRLVRFVASGLKGVARAGGAEEAKSWDLLGEMLESGLGTGAMRYR